LIARTYYEAALQGNVPMARVTVLLESIRPQLIRENPYKTWKELSINKTDFGG
jgi:hypothetical protein